MQISLRDRPVALTSALGIDAAVPARQWVGGKVFENGAKRIRTADPLNAIEVRYQLRYSPLRCDPCPL